MKSILFSSLGLFLCLGLTAQNINDVLRYTNEDLIGNARFQGLSGATGALGGDISGVQVNPAGAAVFLTSQASFTVSHYAVDNESLYFNGRGDADTRDLELNQVGTVFVYDNGNSSSDWKKFALSVGYENGQNFDNEIIVTGNSPQGIDQYFRNSANGVPFGQILLRDGELIEDAYLDVGASLGFGGQQAFLGYYGGVIDPVDETNDNNTAYNSRATYNNVQQRYLRNSTGFNSKTTINLAAQYGDHLYLGTGFNIHVSEYDVLTEFDETGYEAASALQSVRFDNLLRTEGHGFSFNLGAIYKIDQNFRVGASYQSPVWYEFEDALSQSIDSNDADLDIGFIDFSIISIFPEYKITTPGKITGSAAIIFDKKGFISFDYSYQDYSEAELRPSTDPDFALANQDIESLLKGVNRYRVGGEYRYKEWSFRGGLRHEESPFEDETTQGDLNGFSLGTGYNFGSGAIDLAYNRAERDEQLQLFESGFSTPATIERVTSNITLSLKLKF